MITDGFGELGFYSLAVLYTFVVLGSLLSAAILNIIGIKPCLLIGGVAISLWAISSIFPAIKYEYPEN